MKDRSSLHSSITSKPLVSVKHIQDRKPSRFNYIRNRVITIRSNISQAISSFCSAAWSSWSLDQIDMQSLQNAVKPILYSGLAYVVGECLTTGMSKRNSESEENEIFYKFLLGAGILVYSAAHRITESRRTSPNVAAMVAATEILGITYLYASTYHGSKNLLNWLPDGVSLVGSIGCSTLLVPTLFTTRVELYQEFINKKLRHQGAQISNEAAISSGLTGVANFYFQVYHFLKAELSTKVRKKQLLVIAENIFSGQDIIQQARNLPLFLLDVIRPVIKNICTEKHKIAKDYAYNTAEHKLLQFNSNKPTFFHKKRKDLRTGDLVAWDKKFNMNSSPISGEVIAYECDQNEIIINRLKSVRIEANYHSNNGEPKWRDFETQCELNNEFKQVYLHAIQNGKQVGVLEGTQLNIFESNNVFIRIKEAEFTATGSYVKTSVINQIIDEYKDQAASLALGHAFLQACFVERNNLSNIPSYTLTLACNYSTMMEPFAESFLRDMVNANLMKEINAPLSDTPMETIDALRTVDFINAVAGYYKDRFPRGVAIISDKTGTLTTSEMHVLGFWVKEMHHDVQASLLEEKKHDYYMPSTDHQHACFEIFASAYQNSKKEREQEEFAIFEFFKKITGNKDCLSIEMIAKDHFRKKIIVRDEKRIIETCHLGLYRIFGGRLTLVMDGDNKYLVFCGVPNAKTFYGTNLLKAYSLMKVRRGVLSRDWCVARTAISDELFFKLKSLFADSKEKEKEKEKKIENLLLANSDVLHGFKHYGTFIVDNPVKKGAEHFLSNCAKANMSVFIETGDTISAAENIAEVLCKEKSRQIIVVHSTEEAKEQLIYSHDSTIIFSEIYDDQSGKIKTKVERLFHELLLVPIEKRPAIIFAGMKEAEKEISAKYLKEKGFFVGVMGDGANDKGMMREAHYVIGHVGDDGKLDPQIKQFVNFTDLQLQKFQPKNPFYLALDIHKKHSVFAEPFIRLANSQEKPSGALVLKTAKMSFECARSFGCKDVIEMKMQHFSTMAFDWGFVAITYNRILAYSDVPLDNVHLAKSTLPKFLMLGTLLYAGSTAALRYKISRQATNWDTIAYWLVCLPLVENVLFSSFKSVQEEMINEQKLIGPSEEKYKSTSSKCGIFNCRNRPKMLTQEGDRLLIKKTI